MVVGLAYTRYPMSADAIHLATILPRPPSSIERNSSSYDPEHNSTYIPRILEGSISYVPRTASSDNDAMNSVLRTWRRLKMARGDSA